jgi:hypothetical protein
MERLTTIGPHLHPPAPRSSFTKPPLSVDPGHPMASIAGTSVLLLTITAAGESSSPKPPANATPTHGGILSRHRAHSSTLVRRCRYPGHSRHHSGTEASISCHPICHPWQRPTRRHQTTHPNFCQRPSQQRLGTCHLRPRYKHGTHTNASGQATSATQSSPNSTKFGAPPPAPTEGGSTRYQKHYQLLHPRPASPTRPQTLLSHALTNPHKPGLALRQPRCHYQWTALRCPPH